MAKDAAAHTDETGIDPTQWRRARLRLALPSEVTINTELHDSIAFIAHLLNQVQDTYRILQSNPIGSDSQKLQLRLLAQGLMTISDAARSIAKDLCIEAVQRGDLSRIQVANILKVHQGTVARWVKEYNSAVDK
jgi:hypothetical protein